MTLRSLFEEPRNPGLGDLRPHLLQLPLSQLLLPLLSLQHQQLQFIQVFPLGAQSIPYLCCRACIKASSWSCRACRIRSTNGRLWALKNFYRWWPGQESSLLLQDGVRPPQPRSLSMHRRMLLQTSLSPLHLSHLFFRLIKSHLLSLSQSHLHQCRTCLFLKIHYLHQHWTWMTLHRMIDRIRIFIFLHFEQFYYYSVFSTFYVYVSVFNFQFSC